jgi:hypothetical protein
MKKKNRRPLDSTIATKHRALTLFVVLLENALEPLNANESQQKSRLDEMSKQLVQSKAGQCRKTMLEEEERSFGTAQQDWKKK